MELKHVYPFAAIVGQDDMKTALMLNVIQPSIGGVLISGEKGTAKTTAVRGLAALLDGARVIELPVNASEDRVVGTINISRVMKDGQKQFEPGLLKEADGNILYVDEINLLDDHLVDVLLDSAASGINHVERDGISFTHSARFSLVGTMNPEEGTLRPQLMDRFGLSVSVSSSLAPEERIEVIRRRLSFERDPLSFIDRFSKESSELAEKLKIAKASYSKVCVPDEALDYTAAICSKLNVQGYRADITIIKTAAAFAALNERTKVEEEDILLAAKFALPHRMKSQPFEDRKLTEDVLKDISEQIRESFSNSAGKAGRQTKAAVCQ